MSPLSDITDWSGAPTDLGIWPQLCSRRTKQLNTETEQKRPFSSLFIWTSIFAKWLENEVENTFNKTNGSGATGAAWELRKREPVLPSRVTQRRRLGRRRASPARPGQPGEPRPGQPRPLAGAPAANAPQGRGEKKK